MIEIFLPMEKIPTATLQQKKAAMVKGHIMMYEPQNVKDTKKLYEKLLRPYKPQKPIGGPVAIYIRWQFPTKEKKKQNTWKDTRPDVDNLFKLIADRLTYLGFFNDDSQLVSISGDKVYVKPDDGGVLIQITEANEVYKI